jgi:nucleoside-diphosphate-sugar epimerase
MELLKSKQNVRIVSRSKYSIPGAESFRANLSSYNETLNSVKGYDIVYLCVGLPYDSKLWAKLWPGFMKNTIDACKKVDAKLIFFDNVYAYGKVNGIMTENTPYAPCSKKGEVKAIVANMLEDEMKHHNIRAIIARSADLYGPYITVKSVPYIMAFDNMMKGIGAQWLIDAHTLHSHTYTLDCARGLNLLWNNDECYQQIWHLPTVSPAINGKKFIELIANELRVKPNYTIMTKKLIRMIGIIHKTIYESYEMLYQNEYDYQFDSTKFNDYFNYKPVAYEEGIRETIEFLKN